MRVAHDQGDEFLELEAQVRKETPDVDHVTVARSVADALHLPTQDVDGLLRVYVRGGPDRGGAYLERP